MSAAVLTAAGELTAALATERDIWQRRLDTIAAIELMAEAFIDHDEHSMLLTFAGELRGQMYANALAVVDRDEDEREADRYVGFVTVLRMEDKAARKQHELDVRLGCKVAQPYQPASKVIA